MKRLLLIGVCLGFLACGTDATEPTPTAAGTWNGSAGDVFLSLTLAQNGSAVAGNGRITSSTSLALTVTGTFVSPNVSLTLNAPGFQAMNYAGIVTGTTITGTLNGSGFVNTAVQLTKQ